MRTAGVQCGGYSARRADAEDEEARMAGGCDMADMGGDGRGELSATTTGEREGAGPWGREACGEMDRGRRRLGGGSSALTLYAAPAGCWPLLASAKAGSLARPYQPLDCHAPSVPPTCSDQLRTLRTGPMLPSSPAPSDAFAAFSPPRPCVAGRSIPSNIQPCRPHSRAHPNTLARPSSPAHPPTSTW